jgi:hypothetical protein
MGIWQWMSWRKRETAVAEIADRVVPLVIESVRPLVEKRIARMTMHEARGYVRARAGHLIEDAIAMVTAHDRPSRRPAVDVVLAASLDRLMLALFRRPQLAPARVRRAA